MAESHFQELKDWQRVARIVSASDGPVVKLTEWALWLSKIFPGDVKWTNFIFYLSSSFSREMLLMLMGGNFETRFAHNIVRTIMNLRSDGFRRTDLLSQLNQYISNEEATTIVTKQGTDFVVDNHFMDGISFVFKGWLFHQYSFVMQSKDGSKLEISKLRTFSPLMQSGMMAATMGLSTVLIFNQVKDLLKGAWGYWTLAIKDTLIMKLFSELDMAQQVTFVAAFVFVPLMLKSAFGDYYVIFKWARTLLCNIGALQWNIQDFDNEFFAYCQKLGK